MPPRLTARDRRRQILEVAFGLFARKGYDGATTREIAEEAGINEALLFRHFSSKENLYWTMIEEVCQPRGRSHRIQKLLDRGGTDLEVFQGVAREILARTPRDRQLTRLLWFTALENHELSARFFRAFIADYYEAFAGYIRQRIRLGVFRKTDPLVAARGFLGMVAYHFLIQELFSGEQYQKFDPEKVADSLAGIWLAGMQAPLGKNGLGGVNGHHVRGLTKTRK
jgi:AcrR family transcriptional regulator